MVEQATLFERLGGAEKIRAIVDDMIDAHLKNPIVQVRFANVKDMETARRHAFEFFAAGTGGPFTYTGRDLRSAHTGMNVSEQEYIAVVDDVLSTLQRHGVGEREQQEVLHTLYGLKGEIIRI
jgi:hemoglobin